MSEFRSIIAEDNASSNSTWGQDRVPNLKGVQPRDLARCSTAEARALIPYEIAAKLNVLPLGVMNLSGRETLTIGARQDLSIDVLSAVRFAAQRDVKILPVSDGLVRDAIFVAYRGDESRLIGLSDGLKKSSEIQFTRHNPPSFRGASGQAAQFLCALIEYAISIEASDIHIIPRLDGSHVKMRVNGELLQNDQAVGDLSIHMQLISRLKVLSHLNTTVHTLPQDGSFSVPLSHRTVQVRLSVMPTIHGEKAVMRILGGQELPTLDSLGFEATALKIATDFLSANEGMLLVAGPTGSGKSTTQYVLMHELTKQNLNLVSVEDPIEMVFPWMSQTGLDVKNGLDYPTTLRAILRQDPDAILIGEIRDSVSAKIAFDAALTGHLVLSTVHGRNAFEVLLRLKNLNVDLLTLSHAVKGIICQRLIPRLCEKCKVWDLKAANRLGRDVYKHVGCASCDYSGFEGRVLAVEAVRFTDELIEVVRDGELDEHTFNKLLNDENYISMESSISILERSGIIEEVAKQGY